MEWNDFLNPRSMLTPGIAGSVVMVIANTLWVEFMIPQKWTALVLSFLLIVPILARFAATLIENAIYFLFNGLIVFALSVNSNFAGMKLHEIASQQSRFQQFSMSIENSLASNSSIDNDNKQNNLQLAAIDDQHVSIIKVQNQDDKDKSDSSNESNEKEKKKSDSKEKKDRKKNDRQFFQKWF